MATLLAIRGPHTGTKHHLGDGEAVIGRSPECTIVVADGTVSRRHAVLKRVRQGWMLEDCGSQAGTFLNGRPVTQPAALCPNDEIRVGHSLFLFDSNFDVQNADFTDNSVYISSPHEETLAVAPVATLEAAKADGAARQGMELLTEIGELFDGARVPFGEALKSAAERMARMLGADVCLVMLYDHGANQLRPSAAVAKGDVLADRSILQRVQSERRAMLISDRPELDPHPAPNAPRAARARSVLAAPLLVDDGSLGVLYFERQELDAYSLKDLRLAQSLGRLLGVFIEARQRAQALALRVNYQTSDSSVVGSSARFRKTLDMVRRVADTAATVLLVGETGSGKEVLAAEVHRLSPQGLRGGPFVAVNCAAIPESLFESELFGHEKGSFTGAYRMRQGYIEQAQGGTLFLDEIGELSLAVQPKLLRFLQEHTFTRVGGNRLLRAEARVVAATNRDLWKEVEAGRFREDLYHRLHVLPVEVPPLRERREDIRLLAEYFLRSYSKSLRKEIIGISDDATMALERYDWPGNVRELANCVERAVLLSDDKVLLPKHFLLGRPGAARQLPAVETAPIGAKSSANPLAPDMRPLEAVEKEHILRVLKACENHQIRASEVLGIHRNTLRKKLQEYGVLE